MNKLVRRNLVRGLPSKLFENDHTCIACQKGKQHKASCKTKLVSSISQPLQMLHMDLFRPTSVRSINHKTYCLVVTDDYSSTYLTIYLLPLLNDSPQSSKDAIANDAGKNTNEDPAKEDDKSGQGEVTNTNNKDANDNNIYMMFTPVNAAGSSCDNLGGSIPVNAATLPNDNLPTDPLMPDLEDTGIFSGAYDDEDVGAEADLNNLETTMNVNHIPTTRIHKDHPKNQIIGDINSAIQTRRMTKISEEHAICYGKHAIGTKWVYRNKKDERGIVVRNKARLVEQVYTQEEGIDYDEVFAPVVRIEAIMLFLAYASFVGFIVYQMDVKC
ncbi:ribonuclease H-like domain-containing protein [Tanacetum coccineum]